MRKVLFSFIILFFSVNQLYSQEIADHAIGLRLGGNNGFGGEISYQHALTTKTRLEGDLGWKSGSDYNGFKLTGLYQWVNHLDGNFNWYLGAGGGLGTVSIDNPNGSDNSGSFLFVAGNAGLEYDFDFPLLLSLDVRPELGFGKYNDNLDFDIALGIRYQF